MHELGSGYWHVGSGGDSVELEYLDETREQWDQIWSAGVADEWTLAHRPQLMRWVKLTDLFNRGHAKYNTEIRQLEGQLGMAWDVGKRLGVNTDAGSRVSEAIADANSRDERLEGFIDEALGNIAKTNPG